MELIRYGSGYRVWIAEGTTDGETGELIWSGGDAVFDVFGDHKWIEPDETVFDELAVFRLPNNCLVAKIQARLVVPRGWPHRDNHEWNCSVIAGPSNSCKKESL